jgi:hypothetical protein
MASRYMYMVNQAGGSVKKRSLEVWIWYSRRVWESWGRMAEGMKGPRSITNLNKKGIWR